VIITLIVLACLAIYVVGARLTFRLYARREVLEKVAKLERDGWHERRWSTHQPDFFGARVAGFFWPVALLGYWVMQPPIDLDDFDPHVRRRQAARIAALERELQIGKDAGGIR
jgi:hypothetical protein